MTDTIVAPVSNEEDLETGVEGAGSVDSLDADENTQKATRESVRDAAEEAFDQLEADAKVEEKQPTAKQPPVDTPKTPAAKPSAQPRADIDPNTGEALTPIKAPHSWKVSMREHWAKIPRDVQTYITELETIRSQDFTALGSHARVGKDFRKFYDANKDYFDRAMANGKQHPLEELEELVTISTTLQMGSPQQKAQLIDQLIRSFKPDMATLAALASGQNPQIPQFQNQPRKTVDQMVDEREAQRLQEAEGKKFDEALERFKADASNEFFYDVKGMMGIAIEKNLIGAQDGESWDDILKKAYEWACDQHVDVKAIRASRGDSIQPARNANAVPAKTQPKPVGSPRPSKGAGNPNKVDSRAKTTRDAASEAWDELFGE